MIMYRQDNFLLLWPSRDDVFNSMDAGILLKNWRRKKLREFEKNKCSDRTFDIPLKLKPLCLR